MAEKTADGWPAVIGAGKLRYLAGWADPVALSRILGAICDEQGIETETMPDGLRRRDTGSTRFYFNYDAEPVTHRGKTIPPAGVLWQDL